MSEVDEIENFLMLNDILESINSYHLSQIKFNRLKKVLSIEKCDDIEDDEKLQTLFEQIRKTIKTKLVILGCNKTMELINEIIKLHIPQKEMLESESEIESDQESEESYSEKETKKPEIRKTTRNTIPKELRKCKLTKVSAILKSHRSGEFKIKNLQRNLNIKKRKFGPQASKEILQDIRRIVKKRKNETDEEILTQIKEMIQ